MTETFAVTKAIAACHILLKRLQNQPSSLVHGTEPETPENCRKLCRLLFWWPPCGSGHAICASRGGSQVCCSHASYRSSVTSHSASQQPWEVRSAIFIRHTGKGHHREENCHWATEDPHISYLSTWVPDSSSASAHLGGSRQWYELLSSSHWRGRPGFSS